jgi:hypothetical protein
MNRPNGPQACLEADVTTRTRSPPSLELTSALVAELTSALAAELTSPVVGRDEAVSVAAGECEHPTGFDVSA